MRQWFFKITNYAEELLRYDGIEWPERIKNMQRNWIGRSEGAQLDFPIDVDGVTEPLAVFTTRPDTVFGATFMVIAPEHPLVTKITTAAQAAAVEAYVAQTGRTSEIDRLSTEREKTGVFTGSYATNPFNGRKVPVWIADYVLVTYGTGAVLAVPAHDQRDFDFATKYGLEIIPVYDHSEVDVTKPLAAAIPYGGKMINSGPFDGTPSNDAIRTIVAEAEAKGIGKGAITYRLRDWSVSRQRFWGAPLPFIHCDNCGTVPVPDDDLPVTVQIQQRILSFRRVEDLFSLITQSVMNSADLILSDDL